MQEQLAGRLHESLTAKGFVTVRAMDSLAHFRDAGMGLGPIIHETTVELRPGAKTYLANPDPIPPHTDHPSARFIGWFCERQDVKGGAIELVDGWAVAAAMGPRAAVLERVRLPCPALDSVVPSQPWPMVRRRAERQDIYFAPWREPRLDAARDEQEAYEGFRQASQTPDPQRCTQVKLHPGDALFIDNRRMLHGRAAIAPDSPRRLHRAWVGDC